MSAITVAGAGAFGTALAIALAGAGRDVTLWARDNTAARAMEMTRHNGKYLPDAPLPDRLHVTDNPDSLARAEIILLAIPAQNLRAFITSYSDKLAQKTCVICCKGVERESGLLPPDLMRLLLPEADIAVLTGPGFATEIAAGLPTALTLAATGAGADALQARLSTATLRLYLSHDLIGAALGGALKNVVAIGCGLTIGAGLGESARAALMTRGYAEIRRLAVAMGAEAATLSGLSGLGDLALTCGSKKSRNFSLGYRLGANEAQPRNITVEGVATARACLTLAKAQGVEMPIAEIVTQVLDGALDIPAAANALLSRPLTAER